MIRAYQQAGYDFANVIIPGFDFPSERTEGTRTISINEGGLIHDWPSFESYPWPDPEVADYAILDVLGENLPVGMKLIGYGPNGVLENAIQVVGYETLCYLLADDPALVEAIFALAYQNRSWQFVESGGCQNFRYIFADGLAEWPSHYS